MAEPPTNPPEVADLIDQGKNKKTVYCIQCPSRILNPGVGTFKEIDYPLPHIRKTTDGTEETLEKMKNYWMVNDMYSFENIGFSNTVNGKKYLSCADCEMGPIGFHDQDTKISYLAVSRVKYGD